MIIQGGCMKYLLLLVLFFFSSTCFSADLTYNEAIALAGKNNKKVLLYFGADWCGYCKKMNILFEDKEVNKKINEFVFLKLDVDNDTYLKKKFSVKSIPDCIIIDQNENILKRNKGHLNKINFIDWLENL